MIRVFIFTFCIVLLGVLLPIVAVDAQRDEATVAANWTFNDGSAKDTSKKGLNGNFAGKPKDKFTTTWADIKAQRIL